MLAIVSFSLQTRVTSKKLVHGMSDFCWRKV